MKTAFASIFLVALTAAIVAVTFFSSAVAASAPSSSCHNATGSCTKTHFVCANEEMISHSKRCDGVEDCADGTDEYMCESHHDATKAFTELPLAERVAQTEVSCLQCTCLKGSITVASGNAAWWKIATSAPRDNTMMTFAPQKQNRPCNPAATSEIVLNVYKKQNKGCRGWVCCFRQEQCKSCTANAAIDNCWP